MAMFSFKVIDVNSEYSQTCFNVCAPNFRASFIPESTLPQYETIDVQASKGMLRFCQYDGEVSLRWTETHVFLFLSSFGVDKGSLDIQISKIDDSLKDALTTWITYVSKQNKNEHSN